MSEKFPPRVSLHIDYAVDRITAFKAPAGIGDKVYLSEAEHTAILLEREAAIKARNEELFTVRFELAEAQAEVARLREALDAWRLTSEVLEIFASEPDNFTYCGWPLGKFRAVIEALATGKEPPGGGEGEK